MREIGWERWSIECGEGKEKFLEMKIKMISKSRNFWLWLSIVKSVAYSLSLSASLYLSLDVSLSSHLSSHLSSYISLPISLSLPISPCAYQCKGPKPMRNEECLLMPVSDGPCRRSFCSLRRKQCRKESFSSLRYRDQGRDPDWNGSFMFMNWHDECLWNARRGRTWCDRLE